MAIFSNQDRFLKWRYTPAELYILYPGETPDQVPKERLISLMIQHDYEGNLYPIIRIEVVLEQSRYYKIIKHKNDVQFKLRIQKSYQVFGRETWSMNQDYINDTFNLILDDSGIDVDEGIKEAQSSSNFKVMQKSDLNSMSSVDNRFEFFLFKSSTIKAGRTTVNRVLKNATVTDAINYIASKAGFDHLLMAPTDNNSLIEELVIPPINAAMAFLFVDSYYGLYKTGSMIYMDLDRGYIMPYNHKCRCWESKETKEVSIVIPKKGTSFSSELCTVTKQDDRNTKYIVGSNSSISIQNDSITYDILVGNDIESVNSYDGDVSTGTATTTTKDSNISRTVKNVTENPYFNSTYVKQSESRNVVMELMLSDYDLDYLKPNKVFHMIFEESKLNRKYRGYYKLVRATHTFTLTGGQFQLSSDVVVKKMNA